MGRARPKVVIVAGPNGAGKSTTARALLHQTLGITEFVNADTIASGLSAFDPTGASLAAGRIMLRRIDELSEDGASFAFETTLAAKSHASRAAALRRRGYSVQLLFLHLESTDLAIERVTARVRSGGHHVPADTVCRRYRQGLRNLFHIYLPLTDAWQIYDNSHIGGPRLIALGKKTSVTRVSDAGLWQAIQEQYA